MCVGVYVLDRVCVCVGLNVCVCVCWSVCVRSMCWTDCMCVCGCSLHILIIIIIQEQGDHVDVKDLAVLSLYSETHSVVIFVVHHGVDVTAPIFKLQVKEFCMTNKYRL